MTTNTESIQPQLTVDDLLQSESQILQRIGEEINSREDGSMMAGHFSNTGGHTMRGRHGSHTSAMKEKPLES